MRGGNHHLADTIGRLLRYQYHSTNDQTGSLPDTTRRDVARARLYRDTCSKTNKKRTQGNKGKGTKPTSQGARSAAAAMLGLSSVCLSVCTPRSEPGSRSSRTEQRRRQKKELRWTAKRERTLEWWTPGWVGRPPHITCPGFSPPIKLAPRRSGHQAVLLCVSCCSRDILTKSLAER